MLDSRDSVIQDFEERYRRLEKRVVEAECQRDIFAAALRRIIATMDHDELDWTDPHTRLAVILEANDTLLEAEMEDEACTDGEAK